jgi:hypothetical protein
VIGEKIMRSPFSQSATGRRSPGLPALLAVLVSIGLAGTTRANPPAGDPSTNKHYTREPGFSLPIRIDDKSRSTIKEVLLYVKAGQDQWQLKESAPPSQMAFKFKAPHDGEYWFTLVTVDNKGVQSPADVSRVPPEEIVMVVVDTEPPAFDVQPMRVASGDLLLKCVISDTNPDYKSLRITYRGSDQTTHVLEQLPGQQGFFRLPSAEVLLNPVRVTVTDLALNTTTREVSLSDNLAKELAASKPAPEPAPTSAFPVPSGSGVIQASATSVTAEA